MKVSGAVAMADDPEHAFGMYFEKINPYLPKDYVDRLVPDSRRIGEDRDQFSFDTPCGDELIAGVVTCFSVHGEHWVCADMTAADVDWMLAKLMQIKASLAP
jgi:hypothetical protein